MSDPEVYRRGDVLWRRTADRVVILLPASGEFLTLKLTGCHLWDALEEPGTLHQLAERLAALYGAPTDRIASDIFPTMEQLSRCGAVAVSTTP